MSCRGSVHAGRYTHILSLRFCPTSNSRIVQTKMKQKESRAAHDHQKPRAGSVVCGRYWFYISYLTSGNSQKRWASPAVSGLLRTGPRRRAGLSFRSHSFVWYQHGKLRERGQDIAFQCCDCVYLYIRLSSFLWLSLVPVSLTPDIRFPSGKCSCLPVVCCDPSPVS